MPLSSQNSKGSVGNSADRGDQEIDNTPTIAQEQFLLQALQGFILPHIGTAFSSDSQKEMARKLAGPQAKKLIAALKEFISSLVGAAAKTEVETTIKVDLNEDKISDRVEDKAEDEHAEGALASPKPLSGLDSSDATVENQNLILSTTIGTVPTMYERVLVALRSHVFNKMPIRLLRFVQEGLTLEISLIERAAIYEHLVLVLPAWTSDEYKPALLNYFSRAPRLETEEEAISRLIKKYSGYAILSHTWLQQSPELTYGDWKAKSLDAQGPGYLKLIDFCKVAYTKHKLTLSWMDTVCINKDSSSELDESIRSMYQWYKRSEVCIVHLADTDFLTDMHYDTWFTRGWTLQELLAPSVLKFYNRLWVPLVDSENDKEHSAITTKIKEATTISVSELKDIQSRRVPISRRMQLAAHRNATREEDTAYSLMGLFNVSFTTAYGEGADRAFYRLLQEILNSTSDGVLDLFNCAGTWNEFSSTSKLLPTSPRQYLERATDIDLYFWPIEPLMLTQLGIRIPFLLMPGISVEKGNFSFNPCGDYSALVSISLVDTLTNYALLQQQDSRPDSNPLQLEGRQQQFTFAVITFQKGEEGIYIPAKCIAIPLACYENAGKVSSTGYFERIYTKVPVVFEMLERNLEQNDRFAEDYMVPIKDYISIPQQDLEKHGMQLVSKYV